MSELDQFNNIPSEEAADSEKKKKVQAILDAMTATLQESGDAYNARVNQRSKDLRVTNVLSFGDSGSLKQTSKAVGKKGDTDYKAHGLEKTGANVGYVIQNVGKDPIPYTADEYSLVDGKYVPTRVNKNLAPGATAPISKKDLVILTCIPEFSFRLANGTVSPTSAKNNSNVAATSPLDTIENFKFTFNPDEKTSVNDVQIPIAHRTADNDWEVEPEYVPAFGYLMNAPEKKAAATGGKVSNKKSPQELNANYIRRMLEENGVR